MSRETEKTLQDFMNFLEKNGDGKKIGELADVYFGQGGNSGKRSSVQECADDYLELADEAKTKKKRLEYLNKALELEPDNLDAALMLIDEKAKNAVEKLNELAALTEKGDKLMTDGGFFRENKGDFWLVLEIRPYMRVRMEYFHTLIACGMMRPAAREGQRMLELCDNDNLGVRFSLMHLYAQLEEEKAAKKLLKEYGEHDESMMLLAMAVLYFKLNKRDISAEYLKRLMLINRDTKKFFSAFVRDKIEEYAEQLNPYGYCPNTIEELITAVMDNDFLYVSTPGFFWWANDCIKGMDRKKSAPKK